MSIWFYSKQCPQWNPFCSYISIPYVDHDALVKSNVIMQLNHQYCVETGIYLKPVWSTNMSDLDLVCMNTSQWTLHDITFYWHNGFGWVVFQTPTSDCISMYFQWFMWITILVCQISCIHNRFHGTSRDIMFYWDGILV